eukprot:6190475-Pleurochrysis_carterae.AAC.2
MTHGSVESAVGENCGKSLSALLNMASMSLRRTCTPRGPNRENVRSEMWQGELELLSRLPWQRITDFTRVDVAGRLILKSSRADFVSRKRTWAERAPAASACARSRSAWPRTRRTPPCSAATRTRTQTRTRTRTRTHKLIRTRTHARTGGSVTVLACGGDGGGDMACVCGGKRGKERASGAGGAAGLREAGRRLESSLPGGLKEVSKSAGGRGVLNSRAWKGGKITVKKGMSIRRQDSSMKPGRQFDWAAYSDQTVSPEKCRADAELAQSCLQHVARVGVAFAAVCPQLAVLVRVFTPAARV